MPSISISMSRKRRAAGTFSLLDECFDQAYSEHPLVNPKSNSSSSAGQYQGLSSNAIVSRIDYIVQPDPCCRIETVENTVMKNNRNIHQLVIDFTQKQIDAKIVDNDKVFADALGSSSYNPFSSGPSSTPALNFSDSIADT